METARSSRTNLAIYKAERPWAYLPTSKPSPRLGWRQFWEGHLCRPDHLSSIPGSQEVARKNQLLGTVFRPPAMCCGTHNLTFTKVLFLQRTLVNTAPRPLRRFHLHPSSSDSLDTVTVISPADTKVSFLLKTFYLLSPFLGTLGQVSAWPASPHHSPPPSFQL